MASKAKLSRERLDRVRFSSELFRRLGRFFSSLEVKILKAAARRAATRVGDSGYEHVSEQDILHSAQLLLPGAVSDLADAMGQHETSYVRRKVS